MLSSRSQFKTRSGRNLKNSTYACATPYPPFGIWALFQTVILTKIHRANMTSQPPNPALYKSIKAHKCDRCSLLLNNPACRVLHKYHSPCLACLQANLPCTFQHSAERSSSTHCRRMKERLKGKGHAGPSHSMYFLQRPVGDPQKAVVRDREGAHMYRDWKDLPREWGRDDTSIHSKTPRLAPPPSSLLDTIHSATSHYYASRINPSNPPVTDHALSYTLSGSALIALGVIAQELVWDMMPGRRGETLTQAELDAGPSFATLMGSSTNTDKLRVFLPAQKKEWDQTSFRRNLTDIPKIE
ncbi:hypothetical protein DFS34DRAFT_231878 [Phlyctochytrium arcticum]|nr:hypothetical protein DFS34DRAFT_231878 [Phlyctochytrium arcticum]